MRLPHPERAVIDESKLRDYCLNIAHLRGRHKARVFAAALGLTADDADVLTSALFAAAHSDDFRSTGEDSYGRKFVVDFMLTGPAGRAIVRSSWIVRHGEDFPRFVTCYVR